MDNNNSTSQTLNNFSDTFCPHRLPCGYCQRTGQMCYINGQTTINPINPINTPIWCSTNNNDKPIH